MKMSPDKQPLFQQTHGRDFSVGLFLIDKNENSLYNYIVFNYSVIIKEVTRWQIGIIRWTPK